jgi:hypothetical protein
MPILRIIVLMFGLLFIIIHATRLTAKLPFRRPAAGHAFSKQSEVYQIPRPRATLHCCQRIADYFVPHLARAGSAMIVFRRGYFRATS